MKMENNGNAGIIVVATRRTGDIESVKDYLSGACLLEEQIRSKLERAEKLRALAASCTAVLTGTPHGSDPFGSRMADAVNGFADLEAELRRDINGFLKLRREISCVIRAVPVPEYRIILEKRYLCGLPWTEIAQDMEFDLRYLYRIHNCALKACVIPNQP